MFENLAPAGRFPCFAAALLSFIPPGCSMIMHPVQDFTVESLQLDRNPARAPDEFQEEVIVLGRQELRLRVGVPVPPAAQRGVEIRKSLDLGSLAEVPEPRDGER